MGAWRWLVPIALTAAIACGCGAAPVASGGGAETPAGGGESSGGSSEVSDFVLKGVDGRSHALSDYLGKHVIVISFWATWCAPCLKEMDQLQTLYEAHADKGLMILSLTIDEPETVGEARTYVKQRGFTYPVLLDTEREVVNRLHPRCIPPYTVVIGKDGSVVWTHEGYVPGDEKKLEAAVLEALGKGAQ